MTAFSKSCDFFVILRLGEDHTALDEQKRNKYSKIKICFGTDSRVYVRLCSCWLVRQVIWRNSLSRSLKCAFTFHDEMMNDYTPVM